MTLQNWINMWKIIRNINLVYPFFQELIHSVIIYWFKPNNIFYDKTQGQSWFFFILSILYVSIILLTQIYDAKNVVDSYSSAVIVNQKDIDIGLAWTLKSYKVLYYTYFWILFEYPLRYIKCDEQCTNFQNLS